MPSDRDPVSDIRFAFERLREDLIDEFERRLEPLREELRELRTRAHAERPASLTVKATLERHSLSISTWGRWLADPTSGLGEGPDGEPGVVIRPNGPGGRILVPVDAFDAWLRARRDRAEQRRERHDRRGRAVAS